VEKIEKSFDQRKILRQALIGVGGSLISLLCIVIYLFLHEGEISFSVAHPENLFLAAGVLVLAWLFDALRVMLSARIWQKKLRLRDCLTTVLSGYFLSGITPVNTGGQVAEIYLLTKSGLSLSEATGLTVVGGALYSFTLVVLFFLSSLFFQLPIPSRIFEITSRLFLLYAVLLGVLSIFLKYPHLLFRVSHKVLAFLARFVPRLKSLVEVAPPFLERFFLELRTKLLLFLRKPHYLALNISMYSLHFFCLLGTTYFLIQAISESNLSLSATVRLQLPLFFMLRFTPIPGASGIAELSFASLFRALLAGKNLGILVFLWRLYTYYLALALGSVAFFRALSR
jgi:hypothetical protein